MNTLRIKIVILINLLILSSCCNNSNSDKVNLKQNIYYKDSTLASFSPVNLKNEMERTAYLSIQSGDTQKYDLAYRWYIVYAPTEFLYFADYMSKKYKHSKAYYHLYAIYSAYNTKSILSKDNDSSMYYYILYNLAKSKELGYDFKSDTYLKTGITSKNIKTSSYYLEKCR